MPIEYFIKDKFYIVLEVVIYVAVKTTFTIAELKKIVAEYGFGKFVKSKPFKAGYVQTNILLITQKGKFVLRCYENRSKESVLFEVDLLNYLRSKKYPCALPITDKEGNIVKSFNRKPFVLFSYVEGRHIKKLNSKQMYQMVKHLALLHKVTKKYKPVNFKYREPRTKKFCLASAKTESERFIDKEKGRSRLQVIRKKLNSLELPLNLPRGIIHSDFDKMNIKFQKNKLTGVLDFDDSTYSFLIYDLGALILYWARFYLKDFDFKIAKKIVQIYEKYRPLSTLERKHLFDALQFHALNIMSFLMYDKWKGKDLFKVLKRVLDELDTLGREGFYKKLF